MPTWEYFSQVLNTINWNLCSATVKYLFKGTCKISLGGGKLNTSKLVYWEVFPLRFVITNIFMDIFGCLFFDSRKTSEMRVIMIQTSATCWQSQSRRDLLSRWSTPLASPLHTDIGNHEVLSHKNIFLALPGVSSLISFVNKYLKVSSAAKFWFLRGKVFHYTER